jgi:hypothetical protein
MGDDDVGVEADELSRKLRQAIESVLRPPILDCEVSAVDIAVISKPELEGLDVRSPSGSGPGA